MGQIQGVFLLPSSADAVAGANSVRRRMPIHLALVVLKKQEFFVALAELGVFADSLCHRQFFCFTWLQRKALIFYFGPRLLVDLCKALTKVAVVTCFVFFYLSERLQRVDMFVG